MKKINFAKMQAAGNDFVVIDNRRLILRNNRSQIAKKLCDRRFGVGADGLLLVEKSKKNDFRMRIFNSDGSEPEMCGNGLRCIAVFAYKKKIAPANMSIETKAGILKAKISGSRVKINMTEPKSLKIGLNVSVDKGIDQIHHLNTGVPHVVFYVDDLDNADVYNIGRTLRYHALFQPKGTNVNFVKATGKNSIKIRTYERGVENETLACGTGSVASALISGVVKSMPSPIKVYTRGGVLTIYFKKDQNKFKDVFLEGEAQIVFQSSIAC